MKIFKSQKHIVQTVTVNKLAPNVNDNKKIFVKLISYFFLKCINCHCISKYILLGHKYINTLTCY